MKKITYTKHFITGPLEGVEIKRCTIECADSDLGFRLVRLRRGGRMNIYLISQTANNNYDTFDSVVVVAKTAQDARNINPESSWGSTNSIWMDWEKAGRPGIGTWAKRPDEVTVELVGKALETMKEGVVCASFNAG
jgi:ketol-acid reductoisomerase